jgi:ketosteroid isomerase-like protein
MTDTTVSNSDIATVRTFIECEAARDVPGVLALVTQDVVFEMPFAPGGGVRIQGSDALGDALTTGLAMYKTWTMDVTRLETTGQGVVFAEYTATARTTTGRDYHQQYVGRFVLANGLITSWQEWFNPLTLQAVIASLTPTT